MNGRDLFIGLGSIRTEYYVEAEECTPHTGKRKTVLIAVLVAAALLLAGCAYLVLSETDWFKHFFSGQMQQALSSGQNAYIEENTQEIGQSVTVDGYTLTVESAIADTRNAFIKLRLQSPPGTALDAHTYWFQPRKTADGGYEQAFYKVSDPDIRLYSTGTWQAIEDGNPSDNSFSILYTLRNSGENSPPFEAGAAYRLHITDLEAFYDEENRSEYLTEDGVWDFDIVFQQLNDDSVQLVTAPVPVSCNDISIEVTSFELRTMSARAVYTGREDEKGIVCFADSAVVLKDGTRVSLRPNIFGPGGTASFVLSSPIVLEEVDYVELRDGTRIPMP